MQIVLGGSAFFSSLFFPPPLNTGSPHCNSKRRNPASSLRSSISPDSVIEWMSAPRGVPSFIEKKESVHSPPIWSSECIRIAVAYLCSPEERELHGGQSRRIFGRGWRREQSLGAATERREDRGGQLGSYNGLMMMYLSCLSETDFPAVVQYVDLTKTFNLYYLALGLEACISFLEAVDYEMFFRRDIWCF
mmetsp:Transcript_4390/g.8535  ORF Transcript_4390/g.8535 Transcript_4390/m.8535 type:complete len:191 (-) Transcript_4390:55-627(-)